MIDFEDFFSAVHEGSSPFPWQIRLARTVCESGWPAVIDLPTGAGKTAALDIAVYHLIRDAASKEHRRASLRIFFIVDRRIVVDAAFQRARKIAKALSSQKNAVLRQAASVLATAFGGDVPLHVSILRGGMYRDDSWTRSPAQPTICVSTVDQVGSRLFFRGYGVTPSMRPIHAGLVGSDSLYLIDEAHLSEPFLQTLDTIKQLNANAAAPNWKRSFEVVRMSATVAAGPSPFQLDEQDRANPVIATRLNVSKRATLAKPVSVPSDDEISATNIFAEALKDAALSFAVVQTKKSTNGSSKASPVVGVIVNRVDCARRVHQLLAETSKSESADNDHPFDVILLIGRCRPFDRDELLFRTEVQGGNGWLRLMEAGRKESPNRPLIVVATQTIEVGADLDFDAVVIEAAPLDALRQRFGRLNRLGLRTDARAIILARSDAVSRTADDPVYGKSTSATWSWLNDNAETVGKERVIDFGLGSIKALVDRLSQDELASLCAPKSEAPTLLPAYLDLWCQTNPTPGADPDVSLFLHGPASRPADIQIVWRADLPATLGSSHDDLSVYVDTVNLVPPTSLESCSVPINAVKFWLRGQNNNAAHFSDVEGDRIHDDTSDSRRTLCGRSALRWKGIEDSTVVTFEDILPGDTIIVPATYGGCDEFGWNPEANDPVQDIADACSRWGRGRATLRTELYSCEPLEAEEHDGYPSDADIERFLTHLLSSDDLPGWLANTANEFLQSGNYFICGYPTRLGMPTGWLLTAKTRLTIQQILTEREAGVYSEATGVFEEASTTGDVSVYNCGGSPVLLTEHTQGVIDIVGGISSRLNLPASICQDLKLAAQWHDIGKLDDRFQLLLYGGDEIQMVVSAQPLAKSGSKGRNSQATRRQQALSTVPRGFRHEALSVQMLDTNPTALQNATDPELVRYLIGTHHGRGRPFFDVVFDHDPPDVNADICCHHFSLESAERRRRALYRVDSNWTELFWTVTNRYGYWTIAKLEAILRLADHRHSELEATTATNVAEVER